MKSNDNFFNNLNINCENGFIVEDIRWCIDREPKPKAKVRIPILMPLESGNNAKTEIKSINNEGGKSIANTKSTYTTSNYITLDIPTHLFPDPVSIFENGEQVRYRIIPKGTEVILVFIGGYMRLEMIRVISISL